MTDSERNILWKRLYRVAESTFAGVPQCHDFAHTLRVLRNAELLLEREAPCDSFAVRVGALLHDIGRPDELTGETKIDHAELGARKADPILRECGCRDDAFIRHVCDIVRTHRYRSGRAPKTLEAEIVYDADKLDSLGAYGVARAFHFAGRIGACLHNAERAATASESYSKEDSAYREYLVKLRRLPEKMRTESGRALASERAQFMRGFFERLNEESVWPDPSGSESQ